VSQTSAEKHTCDWEAEKEYRSGGTMKRSVRRHVLRLCRDGIDDESAANGQSGGDNSEEAERDPAAGGYDLRAKGRK
jgi:hypothetical protein